MASAARSRGWPGSRIWRGPLLGLEEYILRHVGRVPRSSREIYDRVVDDYGEVSMRTVHRKLAALRMCGSIVVTDAVPNGGNPQLFYKRRSI